MYFMRCLCQTPNIRLGFDAVDRFPMRILAMRHFESLCTSSMSMSCRLSNTEGIFTVARILRATAFSEMTLITGTPVIKAILVCLKNADICGWHSRRRTAPQKQERQFRNVYYMTDGQKKCFCTKRKLFSET